MSSLVVRIIHHFFLGKNSLYCCRWLKHWHTLVFVFISWVVYVTWQSYVELYKSEIHAQVSPKSIWIRCYYATILTSVLLQKCRSARYQSWSLTAMWCARAKQSRAIWLASSVSKRIYERFSCLSDGSVTLRYFLRELRVWPIRWSESCADYIGGVNTYKVQSGRALGGFNSSLFRSTLNLYIKCKKNCSLYTC